MDKPDFSLPAEEVKEFWDKQCMDAMTHGVVLATRARREEGFPEKIRYFAKTNGLDPFCKRPHDVPWEWEEIFSVDRERMEKIEWDLLAKRELRGYEL